MCLKVRRLESRSAVPATIFHRGYQNPLPVAASQCSPRCHGLILNYLTSRKMRFYTHTLMHAKADASGKFPVSWDCTVKYAACEHWADLAGVWLYVDSDTSCLDYAATKFWEHLPELLSCFVGWSFIFNTSVKGLSLDFHLFTCIILICVILQRSTCGFMVKEAVSGEARSLLLWRSETRLRHTEEITCKPRGGGKAASIGEGFLIFSKLESLRLPGSSVSYR